MSTSIGIGTLMEPPEERANRFREKNANMYMLTIQYTPSFNRYSHTALDTLKALSSSPYDVKGHFFSYCFGLYQVETSNEEREGKVYFQWKLNKSPLKGQHGKLKVISLCLHPEPAPGYREPSMVCFL